VRRRINRDDAVVTIIRKFIDHSPNPTELSSSIGRAVLGINQSNVWKTGGGESHDLELGKQVSMDDTVRSLPYQFSESQNDSGIIFALPAQIVNGRAFRS